METLKEFLTHKGWIASMLGVVFILPINVFVVIRYFKKSGFSEVELITIATLNVLAMIWMILPSKVILKALKFEFSIED